MITNFKDPSKCLSNCNQAQMIISRNKMKNMQKFSCLPITIFYITWIANLQNLTNAPITQTTEITINFTDKTYKNQDKSTFCTKDD